MHTRTHARTHTHTHTYMDSGAWEYIESTRDRVCDRALKLAELDF